MNLTAAPTIESLRIAQKLFKGGERTPDTVVMTTKSLQQLAAAYDLIRDITDRNVLLGVEIYHEDNAIDANDVAKSLATKGKRVALALTAEEQAELLASEIIHDALLPDPALEDALANYLDTLPAQEWISAENNDATHLPRQSDENRQIDHI